jgi:hypothetical protein
VDLKTSDVLTIIAIVAGPIVAVMITRWIDESRERTRRRMDVFRTLMRTRRTPATPEHVGALNLIYAGDASVIANWKTLFTHFAAVHGRNASEQISDSLSLEERAQRENRFSERLGKERQALLSKLIHAMAKALKFRIEQLEIFEGGYTPQGWVDDDLQSRRMRQFLIDLYDGRKWLPVGVFQGTPPANPTTEEKASVAKTPPFTSSE